MTIVEGTTQAGLPFRPQSSEEAGSQSIPVSHPDQELEAGAEGSSAEPQLNQPDPPTEIAILDVIVSFKKSFNLFLQYLKQNHSCLVCGHKVGSLLITVECSSFQILEGLWLDYCSGHLTEIAQKMLVTAEVLEKLSLMKVKVQTFISEKEYEEGKQFFMDNSGELIARERLACSRLSVVWGKAKIAEIMNMNFMFEWQKRYLTRSLRSLVRYRFCHSNIKFISLSQRVMFFLLYGDHM